MSNSEYIQQLEQVKIAIESTHDEEEKRELISLKNSIEELLSLTSTSELNDNNNLDDEYALFQDEINNLTTENKVESSDVQNNSSHSSLNEFKSLEGKKCKAPHINKWGGKGYHNAVICSVIEGLSEPEVKILFTNPVHEEMLPCPYFLNSHCTYLDGTCKYSHGVMVPLSDIQDYVEPNFEFLKVGSEILAKQENKLWGRARIRKILDGSCIIKFLSAKEDIVLPFDEILPLEGEDNDEEEDDSCDSEMEMEDVVNRSLLTTPPNRQIGDWEKFTKGMGSKLMQKMGYIVGTGLGKRSDGRLEPVTAVILPAGKSLDHCMNLKEKYGEKYLLKADRKRKFHTLKQRKKAKLAKKRIEEHKKNDIFQFINQTVNTGESTVQSKSEHRKDIKNETSRDLNVASMKIEEDIKNLQRNMYTIKESLTRHKNSPLEKTLEQKLELLAEELKSLESKAQNIKNEQDVRRDKKKLTVF